MAAEKGPMSAQRGRCTAMTGTHVLRSRKPSFFSFNLVSPAVYVKSQLFSFFHPCESVRQVYHCSMRALRKAAFILKWHHVLFCIFKGEHMRGFYAFG